MKFIDTSPFPALCFQFRDTGAMRWVVVLRATFDIGPAGALTKRSPQPPLQLAEQAYGDIDATPPRRETQLAPQKPRTDLVVHATAHAPGGKPAPRFDVALRVRD
ncbi:MAG TPA: DUF2169 domain-containing protein, partial [Minicystis sp.]|nr:DUF2169 domain-containing protein [Minicystis sp.]